MDELLVAEGTRRLKVSIAGIDAESRRTTPESIKVTLFAYDEGPPVNPLMTMELNTEEAARLYAYLGRISLVRDRACTLSGRFVEVDDFLPREVIEAFLGHPDLLSDPEIVRSVLTMNPHLCRSIIENELDMIDIQSLAYRRQQLGVMRKLLTNDEFFEEYRIKLGIKQTGLESVWQRFFEKNQWIFGLALHYVIGEGVDPNRLEQVVAGHSISSAGKRVDALLRSRGILSSLCYVEIKTHKTQLLHISQYRPEVWRPSDELIGAVAQSHKTVQRAIEHLSQVLSFETVLGEPAETFFNYAPRAIVICGCLGEFDTDMKSDQARFSSFELFRRSIQTPDIITFDELHERAVAIVEAGFAAKASTSHNDSSANKETD